MLTFITYAKGIFLNNETALLKVTRMEGEEITEISVVFGHS